jgi:hypothetical protein
MTLFADVQPISRVDHADLKLQPIPGYGFAAEATELPVFGHELPHLVAVLPLAFRIADRTASLVGITGVRAGRNAFVGPRGGWNAVATPEVLTTYPFTMRTAADGSQVLAADMASALLDRDEGDPVLDADGAPTAVVTDSLDKLRRQARDRQATAKGIAALWNAGVLVPWQVDDVTAIDPDVHYRVRPEAIPELPRETQADLIQRDALSLAYAQAYAMANMRKLRRMGGRPPAPGPAQPAVNKDASGDDDLDFGDDLVLDFG